MNSTSLSVQKRTGAYYTPDAVAAALVRWVVVHEDDRLLDPACGDGRFIAVHPQSFGVEQDEHAGARARVRASNAEVHTGEFFAWATNRRFNCAAGNPPFIRYQRFTGSARTQALLLCRAHGTDFSGLV